MEPLYTIQIGLGLQEHSIKVFPDRVVIQKPKDKYSALGVIKKELQMQGIQFSGPLSFLNAKYIGIDVTFDEIESVDFRPATGEIMMNGLIVVHLKGRERVNVTFWNYAKTANAIKFRSDYNDTAIHIKQYIDSKLAKPGSSSGLQKVFRSDGCSCQKMRFFYEGNAVVSRSIGDRISGSFELYAGRSGAFSIKFTDNSNTINEGCCFEFDPNDSSAGKKRSEYTEFIHEGRRYTCICCFDLSDHLMKQYVFTGNNEIKTCARHMGITQVTTRDTATSEITGTRPL